MAIASFGSRTYTNNDGLKIRFGLDQAEEQREGAPRQAGSTLEYEFDVDTARMAAFGTNQVLNKVPTVALPSGMLLKSAILTTITPFTSAGAMTLSIGTCGQDGTELDNDGIDAAIALTAIDAVGETVTCDGALIGTVLAADSYLTLLVNVADPTAGKAKLIVTLMPVSDV